MALKLRTVVFSHQAREEIVERYGGAELADHVCVGFEFILAHKPESGVFIGSDMWMLEMESNGVWKNIVCFYTFDTDTVTVHDVVTA